MRLSTAASRHSIWLLGLSLWCGSGCSSSAESTADATAASSSSAAPSSSGSSAPAGAASSGVEADGLHPLFADDGQPADPLAKRVCDALYRTPEKRRAECCASTTGGQFANLCDTTLSVALRAKKLTLDEERVAACEATQTKQHEGCAWVGQAPLPLAPACRELFGGTLEAGAACRSSLECKDGLRCHGLGAVSPGRCGAPRKDKDVCGQGVDTLAAIARQDALERKHPECEGECHQLRCHTAAQDTRAKEGEACGASLCGEGLVCADGTCRTPGLEGAACKKDIDCRGGCVAGKCERRCTAAIPTFAPPKPSRSSTPR